MRRKLMPALWNLRGEGCLENVQILGIGRTTMTDDEFRASMSDALVTADKIKDANDADWRKFAERIHYRAGEINDESTYRNTAKTLEELVAGGSSSSHLFYLAIPPSLMGDVVDGLGKAGLNKQDERHWSRIVVEKPFGTDLESARALNAKIAEVFAENQVYRIDHYLGTDTAQVLRSIMRLQPHEVGERTVRAQYGPGEINGEPVKGYCEEEGVAKDSQTETYVAIEFRISNWRWSGVPFYVRTGKSLRRNLTEIAVHLKRTPQALFARKPDEEIDPNSIVLRIQPNEGISVTFGAKRPGFEMKTTTVDMDFCYQQGFGVEPPAAYETLLLDVMQGDATLFTRGDEVEHQWRLITPIEEAWASERVPPLTEYAAGSDGPASAEEMLARDGHRWRSLTEKLGSCD